MDTIISPFLDESIRTIKRRLKAHLTFLAGELKNISKEIEQEIAVHDDERDRF